MSHELDLQFRTPPDRRLDIEDHLSMIRRLIEILGAEDALLGESAWYLSGDTKDDSYRDQLFGDQGPTAAALAVLKREQEGKEVVKSFAIWNGQLENEKGASIAYYFDRTDGSASGLRLTLGAKPSTSRLGAWPTVARVLSETVKIWQPLIATIDKRNYSGVFLDRPRAGWMLYLPTILTDQQVPEARALVSVLNEKNKQLGTIVVSVVDGPFSGSDPEHVRVAHAIEVRLVDQDLLPRYADL
ncbi:Imm52 family immunity protein [Cupriavidus neocaledonicus]|uniref:Immunity protein 52 domain-containing protein n=1 Tax=Cupriavidus neocaledonicus TaxID=1040979 RepID=A0ABY1V3B4_9BURK|nr:Imm52 family immunity protein [Cupriavidus neocaledonicus]SOZ36071.1 conserved hypothetical protein [Cupriavidus neocaledonicus]